MILVKVAFEYKIKTEADLIQSSVAKNNSPTDVSRILGNLLKQRKQKHVPKWQ